MNLDITEEDKKFIMNYGIFKFAKLNISFSLFDLASSICDSIVLIILKYDLNLKIDQSLHRIKKIYENIMNGYLTLFKLESYELDFLNSSILYKLSLKILSLELNVIQNELLNEKSINSCWSLFDVLFLNKF